MSRLKLVALDRPEVPALVISPRLRSQLVYFMASPGAPGVPPLGENEFWFPREEVSKVLDDGVVYLISPLDTANMTEVEISEEQEGLLNWLAKHGIEHARAVEE
jgi:hypothetical protein